MRNIHLHNVTVDIESLDILSADTDFYAYIGSNRLYNTFEKFICSDDHNKFMEIIGNRDSAPFIVNLLDKDNNPIPTYMSINYEDDRMFIELEDIQELRDGQELMNKLLNNSLDVLGLHNDIVFSYNRSAGYIKLFTSDARRCTHTYSLDDFISEVRSLIPESEYELLDKLIISLNSTSGSFAYTFTGNILKHAEKCKSSIVKGIATNRLDSISVLGYIHRGSNKGNASHVIEKDALTGTLSKNEIASIARKAIEVDHQHNVCICIIDLDYFKNVNDNFGHMTGDKVLKEVADIIISEVGVMGDVGRFGGDEFFVIFYDVADMEKYREKLRSIKNIVNTRFPKTDNNSKPSITLSIGCASYPKDADNYEDLFTLADFCLYRAKDKGRNRYIIYSAEKHGTLEEIKNFFNNNRRIDSRKDMAIGDVISMINDKHYMDKKYTPEMLVDDLVENLPVERIICLSGTPLKCRCMSGINLPTKKSINSSSALLETSGIKNKFKDDILVVNDIEILKNFSDEVYQAYKNMEVKSFVQVQFLDAAERPCLISLETTTAATSWNMNQMFNYRSIARMFSRFEL